MAAWLVFGGMAGAGCSRASARPGPPLAAALDAGVVDLLAAIARAEDERRAGDLPAGAQAVHDPAVRRVAARAQARILDADDGPLLRALEDDDPVTVAWGAYGLGEACRGREDRHVRALAARASSLDAGGEGTLGAGSAPAQLDPRVAIVRAIGRCGGGVAEATLTARVRAGGPLAEAAAYALGDVAVRAGSLSLESGGALLTASLATPPLAAALYPFGRGEGIAPDEIAPRLLQAARAALSRPGPERVFAVRALGRVPVSTTRGTPAPEAEADLARVLGSDDFAPAERIEAAHGLARLGKAGQAAIADGVAALADATSGDRYSILLATLECADDQAASRIAPALWALARTGPGPSPTPAALRRASALRCAAAQKLSHAAWDADVIRSCDLGDGEAGDRARMAALDRAPLVHARRAAWLELARSPRVRTREATLGMIARHAEIGDAVRSVLAEALVAPAPGVVAAAAAEVQAHPERVVVLAESERRAALDLAGPPPRRGPAREVDLAVASALRAALARFFPPDRVEVRAAVLDAAAAIGLPEGKAAARAACADANATVRARAAKALAAYGEGATTCAAPSAAGELAPELGRALSHPVRVALDTDAGPLTVRLDPSFAPVAVTRIAALARAGFYTGVTFHRVVPGFVAQLGDPGGDGFGGSGTLLRCETSPVPFQPLEVGVALAGRDTGSSQFFVTLARSPHLDGAYAWIGRAEGDWAAVAEGDVIRAVRVEE
jgi:cyclophilin family peptidyl-prolyl cis-trans isomerase